MKLEKIKNTFGDYKLELSFAQLEAISQALAQSHADPVADELYAEWQWYMERVPGPGEEDEDKKGKDAENDDTPLPLPPGDVAGTPPETEELASTDELLPKEGAEGAGAAASDEISDLLSMVDDDDEDTGNEPAPKSRGTKKPADSDLDLPPPPEE